MRRDWVNVRMLGLLGLALVAGACGSSSKSTPPPTPSSFGLLATVQLGNLPSGKPGILTSMDISWFDNFGGAENVWFTDSGNNAVDQINTANNTFVQYINQGKFGGNNSPTDHDCNGPNGAVTAIGPNNSFHELWVGDISGANATNCATSTPQPVVWAFDLTKSPPVPVSGFTNPVSLTCGVGGAPLISGDPSKFPTVTCPAATAAVNRGDELSYDSKDDLILIATPHPVPGVNPADPAACGAATCGPWVSIVQAGTGKVLGQIIFPQADGGLEQSQWSASTDTFYQNLPTDSDLGNDANGNEIGGVAQIKINSVSPLSVTVTVPTTATSPFSQVVSCGATGMALLPNGNIFLGCPNSLTPNTAFPAPFPNTAGGRPANFAELMNPSGSVIAAPFGNLAAADEVWYDQPYNLFAGAGFNGVIGIVNAATNQVGASVLVAPSPPAHSVTADSVNGHIIVPGPLNTDTWDNSAPLTVIPNSTQPGNFSCTKGCVWVFGASPNNSYPVE